VGRNTPRVLVISLSRYGMGANNSPCFFHNELNNCSTSVAVHTAPLIVTTVAARRYSVRTPSVPFCGNYLKRLSAKND
jgi:hypothetical protein